MYNDYFVFLLFRISYYSLHLFDVPFSNLLSIQPLYQNPKAPPTRSKSFLVIPFNNVWKHATRLHVRFFSSFLQLRPTFFHAPPLPLPLLYSLRGTSARVFLHCRPPSQLLFFRLKQHTCPLATQLMARRTNTR